MAEGGARVAVAMYKRVHLREIAGGAEAAPPLVFDDWVNCCAFVGGGAVAFAGDAASVNVWDRGQTITVTHGEAKKTDSVLAMACRIAGDEATIATGDNDGRINVWTEKEREDTSERREFEQYRFTKVEGWVVSICFYAHGLAACTSLRRVCVLEPGKCEVISMSTSWRCAMAWVGSVGDRLVTACEAKLVHAWRRQGDSLKRWVWTRCFPGAARFGSPDVGGQGAVAGKRIAVGDESGRSTCWTRSLKGGPPSTRRRPRGTFVAACCRLFRRRSTAVVHIYFVMEGRPVSRLYYVARVPRHLHRSPRATRPATRTHTHATLRICPRAQRECTLANRKKRGWWLVIDHSYRSQRHCNHAAALCRLRGRSQRALCDNSDAIDARQVAQSQGRGLPPPARQGRDSFRPAKPTAFLETAVRTGIAPPLEQMTRLDNLATGVKVTEKQYPELHASFQEAIACLGGLDPEPELFVKSDPRPGESTRWPRAVERRLSSWTSALVDGFSAAETSQASAGMSSVTSSASTRSGFRSAPSVQPCCRRRRRRRGGRAPPASGAVRRSFRGWSRILGDAGRRGRQRGAHQARERLDERLDVDAYLQQAREYDEALEKSSRFVRTMQGRMLADAAAPAAHPARRGVGPVRAVAQYSSGSWRKDASDVE